MDTVSYTICRPDTGAVLPYASITVCRADGVTKATIYNSLGNIIVDSVVEADINGAVTFQTDENIFVLFAISADGEFNNPPIYIEAPATKAKLASPTGAVNVQYRRNGALVTRTMAARIDQGLPIDPFDADAKGDGSDDTDAVATVLTAATHVKFPKPDLGFRTTSEIQLRSGQRIIGDHALVYRSDQSDHLFGLNGISDVKIEGLVFSHSMTDALRTGALNSKSCIHGYNGASRVSVKNCDFFDTGLFAISSDDSGDGWQVIGNRGLRIGATFADVRGGKGHEYIGNDVELTGDDALVLAGQSCGLIIGNTLRKAGMMPVFNELTPGVLTPGGGGGIRFNRRTSVIGNHIFDANLFFIAAASYSIDATARPDMARVIGNTGRGLKPSFNNSSAIMLLRNIDEIFIQGNTWDVRSETTDVTITNVTNNGSGFARVTAPGHGYQTGNRVRIEGAGGVGNGVSIITRIDANTFDMNTLAFSGAYTSGGVAYAGLHYARIYTASSQPINNKRLKFDNETITNVENIFYTYVGGASEIAANRLDVTNYTYATDFLDGSTLDGFTLQDSTLRAPRGGTGALFYSSSSGGVVLGAGPHRINNNRIVAGAVTVNTPLAFNNTVCSGGTVEAVNNRLAGAASTFANIGNLPIFDHDGDLSINRRWQGTVTITVGTKTATATHSLGFAPRRSEVTVREVTAGACRCAGLSIDNLFTTTLVVNTTANVATSDATIHINIAPAVRRYVNGTTGV